MPNLTSLLKVPDAVVRCGSVIAGLDGCLLAGFGRLGSEQVEALASLGRAFGASPLGVPLQSAIDAVRGNDFQEKHFTVIAAARSALQAARYDALREQACAALGRPVPASPDAVPGSTQTNSDAAVLCGSTRHWLTELAIAGFKNLDAAALAPFQSTLESLQSDATLGRLGGLLTGFQRELLAAIPIGANANVPVYRWGDLWARGMVLSARCERGHATLPVGEKVSGTLTVLGVDVRQHGAFVSDVVYALLESTKGSPRVVRVTVSSYKVDALQGGECWRCYGADASLKPLVRAMSESVPLKVKDATLLPDGDLLWDGSASEDGKPVDVCKVAAAALASDSPTLFPSVAPEDRHPVQLAELALLEGLAGNEPPLPIATARFAPGRGLEPENVAGADAMLGLLRFDADRWMIQPLAIRGGGKKPVTASVGSNALEAMTKKPKKGEPDTLAILRERAGRLLRKKS